MECGHIPVQKKPMGFRKERGCFVWGMGLVTFISDFNGDRHFVGGFKVV